MQVQISKDLSYFYLRLPSLMTQHRYLRTPTFPINWQMHKLVILNKYKKRSLLIWTCILKYYLWKFVPNLFSWKTILHLSRKFTFSIGVSNSNQICEFVQIDTKVLLCINISYPLWRIFNRTSSLSSRSFWLDFHRWESRKNLRHH